MRVELTVISDSPHCSFVASGFVMLARDGELELSISRCSNPAIYPTVSMLEVLVDGKTKIAYDLLDGYNLDMAKLDDYLENVDFYFKRSFSSELNGKLRNGKKILPLGLNYQVTTRGNPIKAERGLRALAKRLVGYKAPYVESFELAPEYYAGMSSVIFAARLWAPEGEPGEAKISAELSRERERLNLMRINCVRELSKNLGESFFGGLTDTAYTRMVAPELIISKKKTRRNDFIKQMQRSDICVTTLGLHGSNGWKLGEYIAASKAIVMERPVYKIDDIFKEGVNYLEFTTPEECVEKTLELQRDATRLHHMKQQNCAYYEKYLRPNSQVRYSLQRALNLPAYAEDPNTFKDKEVIL